MVLDVRSEFTHQIEEVLLDDANDVEAVGDDPGVGEVLSDQGPVGTAQVHADDADVFLAFEGGEVGVEFFRSPSFDDIEDLVSPEVAEGGGEACASPQLGSLSFDGVFINAEHGRTDAIEAFASFALGVFVVEAFDRSGADGLFSGENTSGNAIAVELINSAAIRLGGMPVFFDTGEWGDEGFTTKSAMVAICPDAKIDDASKGIEVAHTPAIRPLAVDLQVPGLATLAPRTFRSTARAGRAAS